MPNMLIVIPLAFQIVAIVFSPFGLAVSPACQSQAINNPACGIQFTTNQTVAFTANGYSYAVSQAATACQTLKTTTGTVATLNLGLITPGGFYSDLEKIPVAGSFFSFLVGLGQGVRADALATQLSNFIVKTQPDGTILIANTAQSGFNPVFYPTSTSQGAALLTQYNSLVQQKVQAQQLSNECKVASGALVVVQFDATDIATMFIGAVMTAGAIAAMSTFIIKSGGSFIIFLIASLGMIWLILSALASETWFIIPSPIGTILYSVMTLMFAIGMIEELGSIIP